MKIDWNTNKIAKYEINESVQESIRVLHKLNVIAEVDNINVGDVAEIKQRLRELNMLIDNIKYNVANLQSES